MGFLSGLKISRTLLPQLLVVIAAFLIMVLLGSFFGSLIVNKYVSRYGDEIISVSAETIKTYLQGYEITIIDIAFFLERLWGQSSGAEETAPVMQEELIRWFKWLQNHDDKFTEIISIYGTVNGNYITTSDWNIPDDYRPETRIWYTGAYAAGGNVYCSDPYTDAHTGEKVVSFSKLLFDENARPFGVIALDVFISIISDYVACIKLMDSGYGILLDSSRRVIVHPIREFSGMSLEGITGATRTSSDDLEAVTSATRSASGQLAETNRAVNTHIFSVYAEMLEHLNSAEGVSAHDYITASGEKIVVFMRELFNGWYLGFALPSDIYYQDVKFMRAILAVTGIILSLLLCGVLTFMHIAKSRSDSASQVKSAFLANMSHEIRTPMNAIIGMTELLEHEELSARQRDYVNDINSSANSLLSIINDILDLSKIESGKLILNPTNYDFQAMLDNINSMFKYVAQKKGIEFRFDSVGDIPKILYGDDIRLRQVLTNLCGNAVKYTEKGYIRLKVSSLGDKLTFEVKDTGMGIKKESLPGIFNAFEQDKTEKNRHIAGTGLGLPISKAFVEMMGGSIMLDSEYEQGTVITVIIPLVLGSVTEVVYENKTEEELTICAPEADVLLVDDNEFNLKVAHGLLKLHSIDAKKASSGKEAIELIRENDYDIVFMDHMMPDMDGIEAVAEIRKLGDKYKTLPIIALTANAVQGAKEMFLLNDFNDFISKPIDMYKLAQILIDWLPNEKITMKTKTDRSFKRNTHSNSHSSGDPKEIINNEEQKNDQPGKTEILLKKLSETDGLNTKLGLSYIGQNTENYINLLIYFSENCKTYTSDLSKTMKEGNWEHYTIKSHALKGVLANIGAENLSEWAAKLEKASKNRNEKHEEDICLSQTGAFCEELNRFQEKLGRIFADNQNEGKDETAKTGVSGIRGSAAIFNEQMEFLKKACVNYSFTDTKKIISVLDEYEWDDEKKEKLENIKNFLSSFDYEKIMEYINQI
ncbi:MAG: response regulator [Treponema sp.]|jgi:signal transduction histidine kinase/CheY-like chemotaxis protein/HPt (histidine-containing phosphotransfer) domain-containing protein|nr:response regulator [Treponema sp.]